jgi:hypothetical protein
MCCAAKVAFKGDTQQAYFVYDLKGVTVGEAEFREKIILFGEVGGENLCLLKMDLIPVGKL